MRNDDVQQWAVGLSSSSIPHSLYDGLGMTIHCFRNKIPCYPITLYLHTLWRMATEARRGLDIGLALDRHLTTKQTRVSERITPLEPCAANCSPTQQRVIHVPRHGPTHAHPRYGDRSVASLRTVVGILAHQCSHVKRVDLRRCRPPERGRLRVLNWPDFLPRRHRRRLTL